MALTAEDLFKNRIRDYYQMEIRSKGFFRGGIKGAHLDPDDPDGMLRLEFYWLAEKDKSGFWKRRHPKYPIEIKNLNISDIGKGCIAAVNWRTGLHITLFPFGGSSFDPAEIEGLEPEALEKWENRISRKSKTRSSKR